jgi:hypothetical protein
MVVHICGLQQAEIGGFQFKARLGKRWQDLYLHKRVGYGTQQMCDYTPIIPATWEMEVGGSGFKASLSKKHKTLSEK